MPELRLLICVDRSHAALAAARLGVRLAGEHGGQIRAVSVVERSRTAQQLDKLHSNHVSAEERLVHGLEATLTRIATFGDAAEVPIETDLLEGEPLRAILDDARRWEPTLILIGRTGRSGPGSPMVGSLAMHLAEFTDWPVVIVPEPDQQTR